MKRELRNKLYKEQLVLGLPVASVCCTAVYLLQGGLSAGYFIIGVVIGMVLLWINFELLVLTVKKIEEKNAMALAAVALKYAILILGLLGAYKLSTVSLLGAILPLVGFTGVLAFEFGIARGKEKEQDDKC